MKISKKDFLIVLLILLGVSSCSYPLKNFETKNIPIIVAFGNSLTKGEGADLLSSYPARLSKRIDIEIINSGINGDTTRDALERIEDDVIGHKPMMVIVEFGANDYFKNISKLETEDNLLKIITKIQSGDSIVVVLGVRLGILDDEYERIFKRVSKKTGALYIADILKGIITNPVLKSDEIHPNSKGYDIMANKIFERIGPILKKKKRLLDHD